MKKLVKYLNTKVCSPETLKLAFAYIAFSLMMVDQGNAQNFTVFQNAITTIQTFITGPFGTAVAIFGLIAVGVTFMMGKIDWMFAAAIVFGIVIIKTAATFVNTFAA